jgi:hypothetical protein
MPRTPLKLVAAAALAAAAAHAGPALATLTVNDTALDGSFSLTPIAYGNGAASAYVTPFLYTGDLGGFAQPAKTYANGGGINYSYSFTGSGTSEVDLTYHFMNARSPASVFPNVTDARFMLDVIAAGSGAFPPTDKPSENWPAKAAGDPDKRQVSDASLNPLNTYIGNNNTLSDGTSTCGASCTTDLALEWDLAQLTPGQSWDIHVKLLDSALLVTGGRYLRADSQDVAGNLLIVGNPTLLAIPEPEIYTMVLAGLALLEFRRRRMTKRAR